MEMNKKQRLGGNELHYEDGSKMDMRMKHYFTGLEDGEDKLNATTLQVESIEECQERLFRYRQLSERMLNEADAQSEVGNMERGKSQTEDASNLQSDR